MRGTTIGTVKTLSLKLWTRVLFTVNYYFFFIICWQVTSSLISGCTLNLTMQERKRYFIRSEDKRIFYDCSFSMFSVILL